MCGVCDSRCTLIPSACKGRISQSVLCTEGAPACVYGRVLRGQSTAPVGCLMDDTPTPLRERNRQVDPKAVLLRVEAGSDNGGSAVGDAEHAVTDPRSGADAVSVAASSVSSNAQPSDSNGSTDPPVSDSNRSPKTDTNRAANEDSDASANPNRGRNAAIAPHSDGRTLLQWLEGERCFGCARGTHTHLSMEVGAQSTAVFRVPPQLRMEFLERYVAEPGPLYLCEVTTGEGPFAMYLDLDYVDHTALAPERLLAIVHELQALVRGGLPERAASGADADPEADCCLVLVTGSDPTPTSEGLVKSGTHLRLPNLHIGLPQAKALRDALVDRLEFVLGDNGPHSWAKMVDDQVCTRHGSGAVCCDKYGLSAGLILHNNTPFGRGCFPDGV